jgi:hypothetical protein
VGTSGTVTVTAASGKIGGMVIPFSGASTGAGLLAVDAHGNQNGASGWSSLGLTPTASWEAAIFAGLVSSPNAIGYNIPPNYSEAGFLSYSGIWVAAELGFLYPASGVSLVPQIGWAPSWDVVGVILKTASGAAATLSLTNPGSVLAENINLDILGPIINPSITNLTNGSSFTVNTTVAGTKHLLIDTRLYTALNDGANVIGSLSHSSSATGFLTLSPGANVLQVSGSGCTGSTLVTVSFLAPYE